MIRHKNTRRMWKDIRFLLLVAIAWYVGTLTVVLLIARLMSR